ncbi:calcium-activated potassium channel subunit beta-3 [Melanotaenia boesemani]|uniref:calcium-activated potassium channel subunit beta-3 n=1 Tax=Melanotaenia boesemani TaxID=1250792 RepID=UPI001C051970|nr:calcium-activated potassium channel subunit beta-3 [Melanotaenia boesemani]
MKVHRAHVLVHRELLHTAATSEHEWKRKVDGRGAGGAQTQMLVSSVGEDRAILLGFTMMAFSVLMFFVVGITTVKPYVNSSWKKTSCVLWKTLILDEWVDCKGVSTVPCLKVKVNLSDSNQETFLHFDEESVLLGSECFYLPKCQMDRETLKNETRNVQNSLESKLGITLSCFSNKTTYPNHAIYTMKYTFRRALFGLLWPCLMLAGGALLVGLVKLTQCLAHVSSEISSETAGGRQMTSRHTQGKLYRLLQRSSMPSMQSPS